VISAAATIEYVRGEPSGLTPKGKAA
jgi:hypothetical protein